MKNIKRRITAAALIAVIAASVCTMTACGTPAKIGDTDLNVYSNASTGEYTVTFDAMNTSMTLTAYGENAEQAVNAARARIEELDAELSTGNSESEVSQLNDGKTLTISDDVNYLLSRSLELNKSTGGAFNPIMLPIKKLWGFDTRNYNIPTKKEIATELKKTAISNIVYDSTTKTLTLKNGAELDFGGIAKGYTSMECADIYEDYGIESGMINLGGNAQTVGTKTDGSDWRVGITPPTNATLNVSNFGILRVTDKAVITSGGYERYFEYEGKTYHHIMDPETGSPAESDLLSVTIVSDDGTLADGLSTSLFVMGKDKAIEYWKNSSSEFDFILFDKDNKMYVSEGIKDDFTSDLEWETISK